MRKLFIINIFLLIYNRFEFIKNFEYCIIKREGAFYLNCEGFHVPVRGGRFLGLA